MDNMGIYFNWTEWFRSSYCQQFHQYQQNEHDFTSRRLFNTNFKLDLFIYVYEKLDKK